MLIISSCKPLLFLDSQKRKTTSKLLSQINRPKAKKFFSNPERVTIAHNKINEVFKQHNVFQDFETPEERMLHAIKQILSAYKLMDDDDKFKTKIEQRVKDFIDLQEKFDDIIPADFGLAPDDKETWDKIVALLNGNSSETV